MAKKTLNSSPCPTKTISRTSTEGGSGNGINQRNSSWVVAFASYSQPSAFMAESAEEMQNLLVVKNDCVGVSINNSKKSFGKMASLRFKATNIWYPDRISPGDWCVIWMQNSQAEADEIANLAYAVRANPNTNAVGKKLCDHKSGLKFIGRVISTTNTDSIDESGVRTITQNIEAQAFLEYATSVYYTYGAKAAVKSIEGLSGDKVYGVVNTQLQGLEGKLKDLALKYIELYRGKKDMSPDVVMGIMYAFIFGIEKVSELNKAAPGLGTPNDAIILPPAIATILNKKGIKKLWEANNVLVGLQKYKASGNEKSYWKDFFPIEGSVSEGFFYRFNNLKGVVPFRPALWDNINAWTILNYYLNPICNEMYTCLRIDYSGQITPTLVMREKPFSTGLFWQMSSKGGTVGYNVEGIEANSDDITVPSYVDDLVAPYRDNRTDDEFRLNTPYPEPSFVKSFEVSVKPSELQSDLDKNGGRTLYGNLPRWKVSESMVRSFSYSCKESYRVNFVQVFGSSAQAEMTIGRGAQLDQLNKGQIQSQFVMGNYQYDQNDITRHGLRAVVVKTPYDVWVGDNSSLAPLWAAMNADWLFNGHLKAMGTLLLNGVVDPIAEGDNLEYRGIVFHIENVSHQATVDKSGRKNWVTSLTLSNGILAKSLINGTVLPLYPIHRQGKRTSQYGPGFSYLQNKKKGE